MSYEAKNEMDKIVKIEKPADREKLIYKASEYKYSFLKFSNNKNFWQGYL